MKQYRTTIYVFTGAAIMLLFSSCNLDGVGITLTAVGKDNTPTFPGGGTGGGTGGTGGGTGGTGGGSGGGTSTDTRFSGTWIASYGDDLPEGSGQQQYAARIVLQQNGSSISGTGSMIRFFNSGSAASDGAPFAMSVTGSASGDDATLTFAAAAGRFAKNPLLFLHLVGTQMAGVTVERSSDLVADRFGHVTWHKVSSTSIGGSWAAGFRDFTVPSSSRDARDRTALMTLATSDTNALSGSADYVEQVPGTTPEDIGFTVPQGSIDSTQVTLTIAASNPDNGLVDWIGFHTTGFFVGAYGMFDGTDLSRFGHATYYAASDPVPSAFQHAWISSFEDSDAAGALKPADFLLVTSTLGIDGNNVTGTAQILDESDPTPTLLSYNVENGVVTGSELTMDLVRSGIRFSWDLRLAGSILVGSYQQFNSNNDFVSRGVAEWRYGTSTSSGLVGVWSSGFFDTYTSNSQENRASQLAIMNITSIGTDGTINGTGTLQLANESGVRQFLISGTTATNPVQIVWSGADLFGKTEWNVSKAGNFLYGTYTNLASDNQTIEFQGSGLFLH